MKKCSLLLLALILTISLSLTALAAGGGFTASPSLNQAPAVSAVTVKNETGETTDVNLVISAFAARETLPEEKRVQIEECYNQIQTASAVTELTEELVVLVEEKELNAETLAVSDLFDLDLENFESDGNSSVTVTLELENAVNFVGLLHFRSNAWELVENASVSGNLLTFTVDAFSPFAIVVDTVEETPETGAGDRYVTVLLGLIAVGSAFAITLLLKKSRTVQTH